jgi:tRNA-Thr(GGU) m(6)t(6)A37 methyltransferase TsaA
VRQDLDMDRAAAESLLSRLHAAQNAMYAGGDLEPVRALLTSDVEWTIPGDNAISGRYRGVEEVLEYFDRRRRLAADTLRLHPGDLLVGDGEHLAALTDGSATIAGVEHRWSTVGLYRVRDQLIAACWLLPLDPAAFDRAWAAPGDRRVAASLDIDHLPVAAPPEVELSAVGTVASSLTDLAAAPKQADEGAPEAWLLFEPRFLAALDGIQEGDEILVLTWLDRAQRDVLRVHPRGDLTRPEQGVFNTRSPDRPNPLGLHRVRVLEIAAGRFRVSELEAVNGTPIVDIKPVLENRDER